MAVASLPEQGQLVTVPWRRRRLAEIALRPTSPHSGQGQMASVRPRNWMVTDVSARTLPRVTHAIFVATCKVLDWAIAIVQPVEERRGKKQDRRTLFSEQPAES